MKCNLNDESIESIIQSNFFSSLSFSDDREKNVFLSYIKVFNLILFDLNVKNILEIGSGQSTLLLANLSKRTNINVATIDMNKDAFINKIRSLSLSEIVSKQIKFIIGRSIPIEMIKTYYEDSILKISDLNLEHVLKFSEDFIDTSLDGRKANMVVDALKLESFNPFEIIKKLSSNKHIPKELLAVYRGQNDDEFNFSYEANTRCNCLEDCLKEMQPEVVFLDGGEFSSMIEWEIVSRNMQKGNYVILHDILFPKSIKNWLVASSIKAKDDYEIIYLDKSTPQGILVAKKV